MALRFLHAFLVLVLAHISVVVGLQCRAREREALLSLKHGFVDHYGRLSSWGSGENQRECCKWEGIVCSNTTGHVVELDLGVNMEADPTWTKPLQGMISSSLAELRHLSHLDLSGNSFHTAIPKFIGSLTHLKYLNLSFAFLLGGVPTEFGNLSHLQYLDLKFNYLYDDFPAQLTNLTRLKYLDLFGNDFNGTIPHQLGNLSHLQYLAIGGYGYESSPSSNLKWLSSLSSSLTTLVFHFVDLSSADNWSQLVSNLYHLRELELSFSKLPDIASLAIFNVNVSTSLTHIDLSLNYKLTPSIFAWLLNYKSSLQVLRIEGNLIHDELPVSLWDMCSLRELHLNENRLSGQFHHFVPTYPRCAQKSLEILGLVWNEITGTVPDLSPLSSLRELRLGGNKINGTLTKSISNLPNLEVLDVSDNCLQGMVTQDHFSNLFKLRELDLSYNALTLNMIEDWVPPFQLEVIKLSSCKVGPHFPTWLRTQKNYHELSISNAGLSGTVPRWFWNFPPSLSFLNLSSNQLRGQIPNSQVELYTQPEIWLNSNSFLGPIPSFFSQARSLFLSYNNFTNSSSLLCSDKAKNLTLLQLSNNQLTELPDCWENVESLVFVDLSNNHLSGQIPAAMGLLVDLQALHLHNNNLTGEIPESLKNCKELTFFYVGHNKLSGPIPLWIGSILEKLLVLILRFNQFSGSLPQSLCFLSQVQVLDLSQNHIKGSIPRCVKNLTAMSDLTHQRATISYSFYSRVDIGGSMQGEHFEDTAWVTWKGKESEYSSILGLLRTIDLSSNNLVGEIPSELMDLVGLVSLNISRNSLSGNIPSNIGQLKSLDFLDLSNNSLYGSIPSGISQLDRLSVLNLSYNNLLGKIPASTQLQTFSASSFAGNPELCGAPLPKNCPNEETHDDQNNESDDTDDNGIADRGFYVSMTVGFIVGILGSLLFINFPKVIGGVLSSSFSIIYNIGCMCLNE